MDSIEERAGKLTRLLRLTTEASPLAIATVKEALQAERAPLEAKLAKLYESNAEARGTIKQTRAELAEARSVIETKGVMGDVLALTHLHKETCQELEKAKKVIAWYGDTFEADGKRAREFLAKHKD